MPGHFYAAKEVISIQNLSQRLHSPSDNSTPERLRRIGLADADGQTDRDALTAFARIFAVQFYDDLCDDYQEYADVQERLAKLFDAAESAGPKQKFLLICLQYDSMIRYMPDMFWWINSQPELAELFADGFLARLKRLEEESKEGVIQ